MVRFQLRRCIPLVRRPFYQRDQAILERDNAARERDQLEAAWKAKRKPLNEKTLDAAIEARGVHDSHLAAILFDEAIGPDQEAASFALLQYGIALAWVGRVGDAE
jgi:hypothetical protein